MDPFVSLKTDMVPPLITVAMPVLNGGADVCLAALSIVKQSFADWELLIYDDGSTDGSLLPIAKWGDPRIHIFRDGITKGLAARLNEAIDQARGRYFARMDHDDVSFPDRFSRQLHILQKDPNLDVLAVRAITIDTTNSATGIFPYALSHDDICAKPWRGFYFPHPTWMGKTAWFRKHRYSEPAPYCCEDQELLLRSYRESKFGMLDEVLFAYRVREFVDSEKLYKTRAAVLVMQCQQFFKSRSFFWVFLALIVFLMKVLSDLFKRKRLNSFKPESKFHDQVLLDQWDQVLHQLTWVSQSA